MFARFTTRNDWNDFAQTYAALNAFRREVDRLFREDDTAFSEGNSTDLSATLKDVGEAFVVKAFVPGLDEKQLKLSLTEDALTLSGERADDTPKNYTAHRKERAAYSFARSFAFPSKVDPEKVNAELQNGVLTVKVHKAAEAKPRQITIKAQA